MVGSAECPYCSCLVSVDFVVFGSDLLHRHCYEQISADLDEVFIDVPTLSAEPAFVYAEQEMNSEQENCLA